MPNFSTFDGSGRTPREIQTKVLDWLATPDVWKYPVIGFNAGTGVGKAALLKSIQKAMKTGAILVPSNMLLDQSVETYPDSNYLKGKSHYKCVDDVSCQDRKEMGDPPCKGCPYKRCRHDALEGKPTYYNPMSYYYLKKSPGFIKPRILLVDEADKLFSMLMLMCGKDFREGRYILPEKSDIASVISWMKEQVSMLVAHRKTLKKDKEIRKINRISSEIDNLSYTLEGIQENPENYAVYTEDRPFRNTIKTFLCVQPIDPPYGTVKRLLDCDKLILTSATLFQNDMPRFALERKYVFKDFGSPIERCRRRVIYKPAPFKMNARTEPKDVADQIKEIIEKNPGQNTIVHVTYSLMRKLEPFFPGALVHTKETKLDVIQRFKHEGGVFLAAGCAEGLDLPGDECRLNIIPILHRENIGDQVVKKRLAKPNGDFNYAIETLRNTIQRAGRSTRGLEDSSKTYVLDPAFARLVRQYKKYIPTSFVESIEWIERT